jgi:flagellar protein FliL
MADEAAAETPAVAPAPKASGGMVSKLLGAAGGFVLTLLAVVAGGFVNAKLHPPPDMKLGADGKITPIVVHKEAHGDAHTAPAIYFAIDPPIVVNFEDDSAVRFLQVTMELSAHDQKAIDGVQKNIPRIRNNLLLLISNRDYHSLMNRDGKEKLRQESLAEVLAILKKDGSPPIDDLLLTSFVVQ